MVCYLEVCYLAVELACLLKREYKCAHVVHLVSAALVVVDGLLVECLYELVVYIELCLFFVASDCYLCLLAGIETEVEGVEVAVA